MKYIFLLLTLVFYFSTKAQNVNIFCAQANCPITITGPADSTLIFGAASISAPDSIATYTWKQLTGPSLATLATPTANQTMVRKLSAPGTYTFSMTVGTKNGATQTVTSTVNVLPVPAKLRTVVGVTMKLVNGIWQITYTFSDGTTQ